MYRFIFLAFLSLSKADVHRLHYGILKTKVTETGKVQKYCFNFYYGLTKIPLKEQSVVYHQITDGYGWDVCRDPVPPDMSIKNNYVFLEKSSNCSIFDAAFDIQHVGGNGSIFVGDSWPNYVNISNSSLNIGLVSIGTYWSILNASENGTIMLGAYTSESKNDFFDKYSPLIILWFMAVFCIIVGSFWSGMVRHSLYQKEQVLLTTDSSIPNNGLPRNPQDEPSLRLTPKVIVAIVLVMCVVLVGLWLLLQYVVYLFIGLFCLASMIALYCCFEPVLLMIPCGKCRTPYFNIYLVRGVLEVRQIILLVVAVTIPIIWVVFRKEPWAWILQDFLGIAFSINVMVRLRLPNLMICTLLLTLLVLYDIFFVFITPFMTPGGTSIMVDVAQGGNSQEQLPMVFKVPLFVYPEFYDYCTIRNYSLLGFGDILVPGLLVSFVHSFDLKAGTPCRLYYSIAVLAYGCGLLLTFVGLHVMASPQPALFYLVPSLLIPTVVVAAVRGELAAMWSDDTTDMKSNGDESPNDNTEDAPLGRQDTYGIEPATEDPFTDSPSGRPTSSREGSIYDTSSSLRSIQQPGPADPFKGHESS